ncbi:hypothetical protein [Pseudooceanicola sp.]|uniref:hypothetical protein n=1 Tax=Pseudooceanicola sp. TaxID=1914328 RepID=UPI0035C6A08D
MTLTDDQAVKRIALTILGVLLIGGGLWMAMSGDWIALPIAALAAAGLYLYAKRSAIRSVLKIDRAADSVTLTVDDRTGSQTWTWPLSDVQTAEVNTRGQQGTDSGIDRPDLVLKDGTRVPMRPYHSAGSQSWHAVAAIKLFLGQDLDDAPVGWIPPEQFDQLFGEEMARHYK